MILGFQNNGIFLIFNESFVKKHHVQDGGLLKIKVQFNVYEKLFLMWEKNLTVLQDFDALRLIFPNLQTTFKEFFLGNTVKRLENRLPK